HQPRVAVVTVPVTADERTGRDRAVSSRQLMQQLGARAVERQRSVGDGIEEPHSGGEEFRQHYPVRPGGCCGVAEFSATPQVLGYVTRFRFELYRRDPHPPSTLFVVAPHPS